MPRTKTSPKPRMSFSGKTFNRPATRAICPQITQIDADRPRGVNAWRARIFHRVSKGRRNRRAVGVSAGEELGCDERSRSEQAGFPPVAGDRQIAGRSAVNLGTAAPHQRQLHCVFASLRLCGEIPNQWTPLANPMSQLPETAPKKFICVICVICGRNGRAAFVSSCLGVCDAGEWVALCSNSVPLCLCASVVFLVLR